MVSAAADTGLRLGRQRILFVGGKGGVGKTTTASALALRLSERGERCLLVSTDPAHSLGDLWDRRIGDRIEQLAPNLWGLEIDPDAQVEVYLDTVKKTMRDLVKPDLYPEIERQMSLARLSPGATEAAMLERMSELMIGESAYERIIFDTAPTGHTLRLLSLPEIMAAWTDGLLRHRDRSESWNAALKKFGPRPGVGDDLQFLDPVSEQEDERSSRIRNILLDRRRRFYQARRVLLEPETSAFILVLIPEKLPILESRKAIDTLREFKVPVLGLVVNRVLPSEPLGEFLESRRDREAGYLAQIGRLFPDLPKVQIPLMARDVEGVDNLRLLGGWLLPN
jgi:arsenite-transporting ATPase